MLVTDLGTLAYREAWQLQEEAHSAVLRGEPERVLLVEHPPVITFGRRGQTPNLIASREQLATLGIDLVESDRGGDITYHGPGQIVAYPIIRLADHRLSVSGYVHALERAIIQTLGHFNIPAHTDPAAVGVWTGDAQHAAKIAAIGVRIRRGVSLHGLALNVMTNLDHFQLIVPCGLVGRPVTSLRKILGSDVPAMDEVKSRLIVELNSQLNPAPVSVR